MTVTPETLTDAMIRELRRTGERMLSDAVAHGTDRATAFHVLLITANALYRNLDASDGNGTWDRWRAECCDEINARAKESKCSIIET